MGRSTADDAAGGFGDGGDDLAGDRLDFLIGERLGCGLQRHLQPERLLALAEPRALEQIEDAGADDLLDVEGEAATVGKATGKDAGKATLVSLTGIDAAKAELTKLAADALAAVQIFGACADVLREAAAFVVRRQA